MSALND